jgi:hypothetical protein
MARKMSYDRIWLCPILKRGDWVDLITKSRAQTEMTIEKKVQNYGNFKVSFAMGGNSLNDELFFFLRDEDAPRFFQGGR